MDIEVLTIPEQKEYAGVAFPLGVKPSKATTKEEVFKWIPENRERIEKLLLKHGAIMFRGFPLESAEDFSTFVTSFGYPFAGPNWNGGGGPRKMVVPPAFTSTESPPHFTIPFHHELAYLTKVPSKLFFYCVQPAKEGGETPIVLSNQVVQQMEKKDAEFLADIRKKKIRYHRTLADINKNKNGDYQKSWQEVFNAKTKEEAEKIAKETGHEIIQWLEDDTMIVISEAFDPVLVEPRTGLKTWFNSAVLLHPGVYDRKNFSPGWKTTYGDNTPIDPESLKRVWGYMIAESVAAKWQKGDVMMIDNMTTMHSRNCFTPPRRLLAAMTAE